MSILGIFISGNILLPDSMVEYESSEPRMRRQQRKAEKLARIFGVPENGYNGRTLKKEELYETLRQNGIISEGSLGKIKANILMQTGFYSFCYDGPKKDTWNWYEFCSLRAPSGESIYRLERKEMSTL